MMSKRLIALFLLMLVLLGCSSKEDIVRLQSDDVQIDFRIPVGFFTKEEQLDGCLLRHVDLGENGYLFLDILDGNYQELAETGQSQMLTALSDTYYTDIQTKTVQGVAVSYYGLQYTFENQDETGLYYSRTIVGYVGVGNKTVMVFLNSVATSESGLCEETMLLNYLEQVVYSLEFAK